MVFFLLVYRRCSIAAHKGNSYALKYTDDVLEALGEELMEFAEKDRSIHFARFCRKHKRSKQWLLDLSDYHPKFAEYYQIARELMSAKITDLSFYDKESGVNSGFGRDNLFRYDDDWVAHMKWKAEISKESPKEPENQCAFNSWKESQKKTNT